MIPLRMQFKCSFRSAGDHASDIPEGLGQLLHLQTHVELAYKASSGEFTSSSTNTE